jgi:GGDEF domain-containing protein
MDHLYRVVGYEFVVLVPDMERYLFERKQYQFRQEVEDSDNVSMASGFVWVSDRKKISEAIKTADKLMYEDKANYYMAHDRRHGKRASV